MKTISVMADNVKIEPYNTYKVDVDMELEDVEYDSLIYDLDSERIVTTKGTKELLQHMSDNDIINYLNEKGYNFEI